MSERELRYVKGDQLYICAVAGSPALRIELKDTLCVLAGGVRRAFPLSSPDKEFSVHDGEGTEICLFESLEDLDDDSRAIVKNHLDRRYFTPRIEKIDQLKQDGGMWLFKTTTTRGPAEFYVRNWRDSSYELKPGRWMIVSVDGKRFEIPNLEALDVKSRQFVESLF